MSERKNRILAYTTKHMQQKIFMLSQKLGMLQGQPISTNKICTDAIIDHFDLNNHKEWDAIRSKCDELTLMDTPIGKKSKQEGKNGK